MRRILTLSALTLALSGGIALADRGSHGGDRGGRGGGGAVVRDHRGGGGGAPVHVDNRVRFGGDRGGGRVVVDRGYRGGGGYNRGGGYYNHGGGYYNHGWARRPIYVNRPIIRERYYSYYHRPAIIVENYNPMAGYYWVPGAWAWDGSEWVWTSGHYEPDASYSGYYDE